MNSTVNPKRIIATNIRTTAEQLDGWRDLYATTYPAHRLSFNAWAIAMLEEGIESHVWHARNAGDIQEETTQ